jgi:hypothetical protein
VPSRRAFRSRTSRSATTWRSHRAAAGEVDPLPAGLAGASGVEAPAHHEPAAIRGADAPQALSVLDRETGTVEELAFQGVLVEIGLFSNTGCAPDLVETDKRGEIVVAGRRHTGVRGVLACGDCTDTHDEQIVIPVGEGAKASLEAFASLVAQFSEARRLRPRLRRPRRQARHTAGRQGSQVYFGVNHVAAVKVMPR